MIPTESLAKSDVNPQALPAFLIIIREVVAFANSGGGIVYVPNLQLNDAVRLAELAPAALARLLSEFVGPCDIPIQRVTRVPGPTGEVGVLVGGMNRFPFVLRVSTIPIDGSEGTYDEGALLVRRHGQTVLAKYEEMVDMLLQTAKNANHPESATTLLDVTLARRDRNPSAVLDRMDLLWCLIERRLIELTPSRLGLLVRSSLRRTPTLFFWLAELDDSSLAEDILLTSINDEDRDTSDAKDSILEVAALFASDSVLSSVLDKMRGSEFSHFRQAATDWPGRRTVINSFEQRALSAKLDGSFTKDLPVATLYKEAAEIALKLITEGGSGKQLGDIGRVIFYLRRPERCSSV